MRKALALVLGEHLPVSRRCVHVKQHGGAKAAVREVMRELPGARFVGLEKARAKTFIGRVERGFDFLGIRQIFDALRGRRPTGPDPTASTTLGGGLSTRCGVALR